MEAVAKINGEEPMDQAIIERVVAVGDLKALKPEERNAYYLATCRSLKLNPLTRPLEYIPLSGKLVLYARKDATDQLRNLHGVSIQITSREQVNDVYIVTARATNKEGRTDESIGAVSIGNLKGDLLCNAIMKAETKSKRRVTLSICGLGFLDETEIETIPTAQPAQIAAVPEGDLITLDQRKKMNDFIGGLKMKFGLTNDVLKAKMHDIAGVDHSSELTTEQADEMIGIYATWLNQLEEAAFENAKTAGEQKGEPF